MVYEKNQQSLGMAVKEKKNQSQCFMLNDVKCIRTAEGAVMEDAQVCPCIRLAVAWIVMATMQSSFFIFFFVSCCSEEISMPWCLTLPNAVTTVSVSAVVAILSR